MQVRRFAHIRKPAEAREHQAGDGLVGPILRQLELDQIGQLVLRPTADGDVVRLAYAFPPGATDVATGDVGEDTEGLLIEVEGTITRGPTNDLPFGYSVFVDDGSGETQIFIPASTGINPFRLPYIEPGRRIRARGIGRSCERSAV